MELEQQRESCHQQMEELEQLLQTPGWKTLEKVWRYQMIARRAEANNLARTGGHDAAIAAARSLAEADTIQVMLAFPRTMLDSLGEELQSIINEQKDEAENG